MLEKSSSGRDAVARLGDGWVNADMVTDATRFALLELSRRRSLATARTDDIECNGEPVG